MYCIFTMWHSCQWQIELSCLHEVVCHSRRKKNHLSSPFTENNSLHLSCFSFTGWEYFYKLLQPTRDKTQHREVVRHASDNWVKMSCGYRTMCGNHVKILRQMRCFILTGTANYFDNICDLNALWWQSGPQRFTSVGLVMSKIYPSSYSSAITTKWHSRIYYILCKIINKLSFYRKKNGCYIGCSSKMLNQKNWPKDFYKNL